jgi:transposase-like protein
MPVKRKQYSADQKAKIALTAIKGQQTVNEIAGDFGVHPTQVSHWKKQLLDEAPQVFASGRDRKSEDADALAARLYQEIGQLKMELDWLKKKSGHER